MVSLPNADGTYTLRLEAPWVAPSTGAHDRDVWTATQLMARQIESWVRRDPRPWFWLHRRFKTRPGEGDPLPAPLPPEEWLASLPPAEPWG
jgi:KDO2-lipid IV(A) lauroyltransferase